MYESYMGLPGNTTGDNVDGFPVVPPMFVGGEGEGHTKLHMDRYEVFVNGDKVGEKIQRTQVEDPDYLESYLRENGFEGFDYEVVGDHIEINAEEDSNQMKEILSSYLSIR